MEKEQYRKHARSLHPMGLAEEDADVNAYRKGEQPPIIWAADYSTPAVVKALLARGARVNARDMQGCTVLHYASWNGRTENVRLLLAAGADVNIQENDGYTALMDARNARITRMLLIRGAKMNVAAHDGGTALLKAAQLGTPVQVALLLANGADVHARDEEGESPLIWAVRIMRHEEVRQVVVMRLKGEARTNVVENERQGFSWLREMRRTIAPKVKLLLEAGMKDTEENRLHLLGWIKQSGCEDVAGLMEAAGAKAQRCSGRQAEVG